MSTFANHPVSPAKAAVVEEMKEKMQSAQGAVFVGFTGLTVADVTKLRRKFREGGVDYKVKKYFDSHCCRRTRLQCIGCSS